LQRSLTERRYIEIERSTLERINGGKPVSYTEQITKELIEAYENEPTRETVEKLAEIYSKSVKSIIGKLSREGVYRREIYKSKTGEVPVTKNEIVNNIADSLGIEIEALSGLEKSPKAALKNLEKAVAGL
jgi:hypothetical protein